MPSESKKLPGVLLLLLSALGILFCFISAAGVAFSLQFSAASSFEILPVASAGALAFLAGLLQIPTLVLAINKLRGKVIPVTKLTLFKPATLAALGWLVIMVGSVIASRAQTAWYVFIPLTLLAVAIPVWWLVEFSRRGLPRSTALREWGTLTIGLTTAPLLIMLIEVFMVAVIALAALVLLSSQPGFIEQLGRVTQNLDLYEGGIDQFEQMLMELARNPVIAAALFLMVGVLAPFVEELIKPMTLWFLLRRPLKEFEGFALGLISGGAFALLESAGLVSQIGPDTWVQAVALRAGTGLLHIGLSGLVGYGMVSSWNQKRFGHAFLYLFGAASLHGTWNSLALLSGFSATSVPAVSAAEFQPTVGSILSVIGMAVVFGAVLFIVLRINKMLRRSLATLPDVPASLAPTPALK